MGTNELLLLVTIPVGIGLINIILPNILKKILTFGGLAYLLSLTIQLYSKANLSLSYKMIFALDQLSWLTVAFIQLLGLIILIYSLKSMDEVNERSYFVLFPLTLAFCNGAVLSANSIVLMIFWGLSGISLYLFGVMGRSESASQSARKTFLIVGGSDVFLILGFVLLRFINTNSGWALWNSEVSFNANFSYLAFFSILIAAFAKAGGFPLHTWVPDFSKDAPVEGVAFLPASLDKLLGIYLLARMVMSLFILHIYLQMMLLTLGALTVIFAVMMALLQHNGKKLLGYHAVSQVGYMIMGVGLGGMLAANGQVAAGGIIAFIGGLFHLLNNTIYKTSLFLIMGSVEKKAGTCDLDKLGGLGTKMPITFMFAMISALAISGIPPFNGFYSKWLIYQGIINVLKDLSVGFQIWGLLCLILAIFGSALTLASFMKFLHAIFLGKRQAIHNNITEAPTFQLIANGILAIICVIFGIVAIRIPIMKLINPVLNIKPEWSIAAPTLFGTYFPELFSFLVILPFILGLIVFLILIKKKRVRMDTNYIGGQEPVEKFRISGTGFYNEIRDMAPLKFFYMWADKKFFDIYDILRGISLFFAKLFKALHTGQLQFYCLWILIGMMVLLKIVK